MNDFDVMSKVARENGDIRTASTGNIREIKTTKGGGLISFAIPRETVLELMSGNDLMIGLVFVSKRDFDKAKKELGD